MAAWPVATGRTQCAQHAVGDTCTPTVVCNARQCRLSGSNDQRGCSCVQVFCANDGRTFSNSRPMTGCCTPQRRREGGGGHMLVEPALSSCERSRAITCCSQACYSRRPFPAEVLGSVRVTFQAALVTDQGRLLPVPTRERSLLQALLGHLARCHGAACRAAAGRGAAAAEPG